MHLHSCCLRQLIASACSKCCCGAESRHACFPFIAYSRSAEPSSGVGTTFGAASASAKHAVMTPSPATMLATGAEPAGVATVSAAAIVRLCKFKH